MLRVQGYPDGPEIGSILMDGTSGPAGANAFLLALLRRHRTGEGGVVEVAQVENLVNHLGELTIGAAMSGVTPPRWGNRSGDFVPQGVYRAAGDDEWLVEFVARYRDRKGVVHAHHERSLFVRQDGRWVVVTNRGLIVGR